MRHGGEELLFGQLRVQTVHRRDPESPAATRPTRILYTGDVASIREVEDVVRVDEAVYQMFSEYEGLAVPFKVIQRMAQVEGGSPGGTWVRRGVDVGDKAWRVLTSWKEYVQTQ
jgi:hypothetical protein